MTVLNDAVRRVTLPDGRPAPEPYEHPIQIDIVLWVPILYVSWSVGSLALMSLIFWMLKLEDQSC